MALYKDGKIYRTYEEQVDHLTEAHKEQLVINQNVSRDILELGVAANLGGYNLVRFAFETQGKYYKLAEGTISNPIEEGSDIGDYFEITSHSSEDIPAYGYLIEGNLIAIAFAGDFMAEYSELAIRNVTKGLEMYGSVQYTEFEGTSLNDYDANERKKQLFNVIDDLAYGTRTQYASFDLNNDEIYNFVFIGVVNNGRNGYSVYVTDGTDVQDVIEKMQIHDIIEFAENNDTSLVNPAAIIGDLYEYMGNSNFIYKGNIRGAIGATGATGATGAQGIQGVQGVQGIQGEKGDKGDPGIDGLGVIPVGGVLSSASELPEFSTTEIGDGYVVLNTSGTTVAYDLYYHGKDIDDYSIIPNWGGIKGDKGDKGDQGEQGVQGVQGEQGEQGIAGGNLHCHYIRLNKTNNIICFILYLEETAQLNTITTIYNKMTTLGLSGIIPCSGRIYLYEDNDNIYYSTVYGVQKSYSGTAYGIYVSYRESDGIDSGIFISNTSGYTVSDIVI